MRTLRHARLAALARASGMSIMEITRRARCSRTWLYRVARDGYVAGRDVVARISGATGLDRREVGRMLGGGAS
jgi:hypothetical protein